MIGCTSDEQTLYNVGKDWWGKLTDDGLVAQLTPQFGDKTAALIAGAKALRPDDSPSYLYTDITSKAGAFRGSVALAERKSALPGGVWRYVWEWGAPVDGGMLRAPHTMEIPFAFDNVDKGPMLLGTDPATFALGRQTSNVWTQFARSGDPNISGLPHWPKYDPATRATMMFNTESRVENDPYGAMRQILATIPRRGPMG